MTPRHARAAVPAEEEQVWRTAWSAALEAVEVDIDVAEELLDRIHRGDGAEEVQAVLEDWVAPTLRGPVPMEFADRARRLLSRQLAVTERLAEAMAHLRAQRRALLKMDHAEPPPVLYDRAL